MADGLGSRLGRSVVPVEAAGSTRETTSLNLAAGSRNCDSQSVALLESVCFSISSDAIFCSYRAKDANSHRSERECAQNLSTGEIWRSGTTLPASSSPTTAVRRSAISRLISSNTLSENL
jgi:hypothetical protein